MNIKQKPARFPGILLIVGSAFGLLFWFVMLFFTFFLGGSPGPGLERTVPTVHAAIVGLGLAGAAVCLAAGIKAACGSYNAQDVLIALAVLLGSAGSIPFFLLDLAAVGIVALVFGIMPPVVYLLITHITSHMKN